MKNKKAVSPIVATVLLVMIVIILAIIILVWMQGFIKESLTKEIADKEKIVEQYCAEVGISPFINDDNTFGFRNTGNVPVYSIELKLTDGGSSDIIKIGPNPEDGGMVNPGFSTIIKDVNDIEGDGDNLFDYTLHEKIEIIPVLLGKTKKGGTRQFTCPEINAVVV